MMPCGSYAAAQRHRRNGEPVDDLCRGAAMQYAATYWSEGKGYAAGNRRRVEGRNPYGIPQQLLDIVETNEPVEMDELTAFIPEAKEATITRSVSRLVADGKLHKAGRTLTTGDTQWTANAI